MSLVNYGRRLTKQSSHWTQIGPANVASRTSPASGYVHCNLFPSRQFNTRNGRALPPSYRASSLLLRGLRRCDLIGNTRVVHYNPLVKYERQTTYLFSFSTLEDGAGNGTIDGATAGNIPAFPEPPVLNDLDQSVISHAKSGNLAKARELLSQMEMSAISNGEEYRLPAIETYTSLINAILERQKKLLSGINNSANTATNDGDVGSGLELPARVSNDQMASEIISLAEKAHHLLIQMEDFSGVSSRYSPMRLHVAGNSKLQNPALRPTSHHYDSVISAFANVAAIACSTNSSSILTSSEVLYHAKNAPYIAQRWLQRIEKLALDPLSGVIPTIDSYYHAMKACSAEIFTAESNRQMKQSHKPLLTQAIFDKMKQNTEIQPTAREHQLLLHTWCRSSSKDAAYRATGVWMSMRKQLKSGIEEMEPTLEDGKAVLGAWSKATNKQAARRALSVLFAMEGLLTSKYSSVRPDLDCYRDILVTMSRSKLADVGLSVPKLFKQMDDSLIFPDAACFDAAILTLRNCAIHPNSKGAEAEQYASMAEDMLRQMEGMYDRSSASIVKPTSETYTHVIQAMTAKKNKRAAVQANEFLKGMETKYASGENSLKPTRDSYVATIHAYASCGMKNGYQKANEVLQRMILQNKNGNLEARPDICSYHAVIRACISAVSKKSLSHEKDVLLVAIAIVQEMKKSNYCSPNSTSYLLLLQLCAQLLPPGEEREKSLRSIFRNCCKDGLVNQQILKHFQSAVSFDVYYREVVTDAPLFMGEKAIPENWTRNLGYRVRMPEKEGGIRSPAISVHGKNISSTEYTNYRMRRRWSKKNQQLLRGGRI